MKKFCLFSTGLFLYTTLAFVLSGCNNEENGSKPPEEQPITYTVTVDSHSKNGATIQVVPSKESTYYCGLHLTASVSNISNEALFKQLATTENLSKYLHTGNKGFTIEQKLSGAESYAVVIVGYDGENFTTNIDKSQSFTVDPDAFSAKFSDLTFKSAIIDVTPLDSSIPYFAEVKTAEFCDTMTDDEFTGGLLNLYGVMAEMFTYTGPTRLTSEGDFGDLIPGTDYYMMAFGYVNGKVATELVRIPFRTVDAALPTTNTFAFEASNIGGQTASIKVTPSQPSVLYVWDVITAAKYKEYGGDGQALRKYLVDYIQSEITETFPTPKDVIAIIGSRGEKGYDFEFLLSETTYHIWAICVDASGNPVAEPALSTPFTTKPIVVSTATVSLEIDKFYNGSDLFQINSTKYKSYNGKAYLPATIKRSGDATEIYTIYTSTADVSDTSTYTDAILIRNLVGQGPVSNAPQTFAVPWGKKVSFIAVAKDSAGNFGPVFRKVISLDPANASPASEIEPSSQASTAKTAPAYTQSISLQMRSRR